MRYEYTTGSNPDFGFLCHELDKSLNALVGGEENRSQYVQYNQLDSIHDVVLVYDEDQPVGCASFKRYDAESAEVKRVFMKEEYRGKGLSKKMLERLEQGAKEQGYKKLILETGKPLVAAIKLYKAMGYYTIPNYGQYKDMTASTCMEKVL